MVTNCSNTFCPGRLIIVDLRDEFIEKEEALGLFVVMLNIFSSVMTVDGKAFNKFIVFDEAHKYMNNKELVDSITTAIREMRHKGVSIMIASQDPMSLPTEIIELSSMVVMHRFSSPAWVKHVQKAITPLQTLTATEMAALGSGEAYLWANKATDKAITQRPIKISIRPRVTKHGWRYYTSCKIRMNVIEYSNRGSRTVNQDYVIHRSLSVDSAIFVLADGMGGYSHGEIASQTVANSIVEYVEKNISNYTPENLLRESIVFANDALMIKRMEIGGKRMGTVIAVLLIKGFHAYISWLGDSRVYKFSSGKIEFCTTDHSIVQQLSNQDGYHFFYL